jgi:hypothetical protein
VNEDVSNLLSDLGPARLARRHNLSIRLLDVGGEARDLGGFASSFGTFERDELAGRLLFQRHGHDRGEFRTGWRGSFELVSVWDFFRYAAQARGLSSKGFARALRKQKLRHPQVFAPRKPEDSALGARAAGPQDRGLG